MYNTLRFSLFEPRKIIRYKDKSIGYALVFLVILTLFMSIGSFTFYLGYNVPSTVNSTSCACELVDGEIIGLDTHDPTTEFDMYGIPVYVLASGETLSDLPTIEDALVFHGEQLLVYSSSKLKMTFDLTKTLASSTTLDQVFEHVRIITMWSIIAFNVVVNFLLMLLVAFVSTLPLLQYRHILKYKQNFVLTSIALSPVAIVFTFYNLISIPSFIFFIAILLSYRSTMVLRREIDRLAFEERLKQMPPSQESPTDDAFDETQEEETDSESSDENDDETDKYS